MRLTVSNLKSDTASILFRVLFQLEISNCSSKFGFQLPAFDFQRLNKESPGESAEPGHYLSFERPGFLNLFEQSVVHFLFERSIELKTGTRIPSRAIFYFS